VLRFARIALLLALAAVASCTYRATEVLVIVDTDIPVSQQLALRITSRRGAATITSATPPDRSFVVGPGDAGAGLPASFAIVPHEGDPLDSLVTLRVEAQSGAIALRRTARFRFTPREPTTVRIFLTLRCASAVSGCTHASPCTQQDLCEEHGEACGPEGLCVPIVTMTTPLGDGGSPRMDAQIPRDTADVRDAVVPTDTHTTIDASDTNVAIDASDSIAPVDVGTPMDVGGCAAGERMCGTQCIPSGSCCGDGECSSGRTCSGGTCVCAPGTHDCGGTCISNASCCGDGDCGSDRVCSGGSCVCVAGMRDCGGVCIANGSCCGDGDCAAGRTCAGGACVCASGTRDCGGVCIPSGNCCGDGDCGASRTCSGGACVCVAGTRDCGGVCIPSGNCCSDGECGANHVCSGGACACAPGTRACGALCIPSGACCNDGDCSAPLVCSSPGAACSCPAVTRRPIYRFARTSNNDHVYSISATELSGTPGWIAEGIRFYLYPDPCPAGTIPLRRFVDTVHNFHFYTSSDAEAATLPPAFVDEGSIGCVATSTVCGSIPLWRKLLCNTAHFYSTSRAEIDAMCGSDEGSVGEVWDAM
jgi:hypothetical protein